MNTTVKNTIAVVLGLVIGSAVNSLFIAIGPSIIPPPEGADVTTVEGLAASMRLFEPQHFIFPFLAHALGTFVGALVAAGIAATHRFKIALSIGLVFLVGGFYMVLSLPSPVWFSMLDLFVAYMPMAYMAGKIMDTRNGSSNSFGPVL
ncbi:hypothetical protein ACSVH2_11450 [Flavobacterium sp. RSB2_4_14]|uniref:hypothetical protein n=1 Tax=Flavobacterium sp. RSB2_4_14 TaxID=3447665 RepID=UPI003F32DE4F